MAILQLEGLGYRDVNYAVDIYSELLALGSISDELVCVSIHANSLDALTELIEDTTLASVSLFCWRHFQLSEFRNSHELGNIRSMHIKVIDCAVSVIEDWKLPLHDWDETPVQEARITLEVMGKKTASPSRAHSSDADWKLLLQRTFDAVSNGNQSASIKTCIGMTEDSTEHHYMMWVPINKLFPALCFLLEQLGLGEFYASFELLSDERVAQQIVEARAFRLSDYPRGIFNLNSFGTPVATMPWGLRYALPNCTLSVGKEVLERGWKLREEIPVLALRRDYLSWRLANGSVTRRTNGNDCTLIVEGGKLTINVGIEHQDDSEPPTKAVRKMLQEYIKRHGLRFKSRR